MKITHYGHACVLLETGAARILIDPGTLSNGFEELRDLSAVLITHNHDDHLDPERVAALLTANPGALVLSDPESAPSLVAHGAKAAAAGDRFDTDGASIEVLGGAHAAIFEDFPGSANVSYLIDGGAFFHPGDSFDEPGVPVDVLGLATSGPWIKVGDTIDYVRSIRPRVALAIHEAALADTTTAYSMIGMFTPEGTHFLAIEPGVPTEL
jgi:L-ascorbate metabolism protein UlaG (beta-lactamase superfamily)